MRGLWVFLLVTVSLSAAVYIGMYYSFEWVAVMLAAALAYGFLSPVVSARRLYFLSATAPHTALLAAVLGIPLASTLGGDVYAWAVAVGLALVYLVGYVIHRGVDPDIATASFTALTASASVLAIYYVLTNYPLQMEITAYIIGDPLLVTEEEALWALGIAVATAFIVITSYREQVCLGIDRDSAVLSGLNTRVYDLAVFTLLAVATVALIRIVGFVLEHVLLLLPAAIAASAAEGSREALVYAVASSIAASMLGLLVAIIMNAAPAGATGIVLLAIYLAALIARRGRR